MQKPLPNGFTEWPFSMMPSLSGNAFTAVTQPAFAAIAELNGRVCENVAQLGSEYLGFVSRRLQVDLAFPQSLASCTSLLDVQKVYMDYWNKALVQYQEELQRLAQLSEIFAPKTLSAMGKHSKPTHKMQLAA